MKLHAPPAAASPVRDKFAATRRELNAALVEREDEIDLALTALVAREHVLYVGSPGTAKSAVCDALLTWLRGRRFSVLLTKFTAVEEVFGPVSLTALKEDRYRRVTTGKLPEADIAFLDELWKGSSAVLNTLLKILNERVFENDGERVPVPLQLAVAASNEWPDPDTGKELAALLDRFLLRKTVRPVRSRAGRQRLLWDRDHTPRLSTTITPAELDLARREADALPWTPEAKEALESIVQQLAKEGVRPGDRRQVKAVGVARAAAWLDAAAAVEPEHLAVLQHVLWDQPEGQPEVAAAVIARVANPVGMRVTQHLLEVEAVLAATDARDLAQAATAAAKLAEIDRQLAALTGNGRLDRARAYVKDTIRGLKLASLEAV